MGLPDSLRSNGVIRSPQILESFAINNEGKIIAFAHNPDIIWMITEKALISPDLVMFIGGHTHGGQWKFPIIGTPFVPTVYGQKYAQGHFKDKGIDVFISSGIGTISGGTRNRNGKPEVPIPVVTNKCRPSLTT